MNPKNSENEHRVVLIIVLYICCVIYYIHWFCLPFDSSDINGLKSPYIYMYVHVFNWVGEKPMNYNYVYTWMLNVPNVNLVMGQ